MTLHRYTFTTEDGNARITVEAADDAEAVRMAAYVMGEDALENARVLRTAGVPPLNS